MGACLSAPPAAAPGTPRKGASVHETLAAETHCEKKRERREKEKQTSFIK